MIDVEGGVTAEDESQLSCAETQEFLPASLADTVVADAAEEDSFWADTKHMESQEQQREINSVEHDSSDSDNAKTKTILHSAGHHHGAPDTTTVTNSTAVKDSSDTKQMECEDALYPKRKIDSVELDSSGSDVTKTKRSKTIGSDGDTPMLGAHDASETNSNAVIQQAGAEDGPAQAQFRDLVIFGDYEEAVKGLGVDSSDDARASPVSVPLKLLAVSEGPGSEDAPKVRVWCIGSKDDPKYWETKKSEDGTKSLALIVANELHDRMVEEGEDSVPVDEFVEEACNDAGESLLVVEAGLLHSRQGSFRAILRAKRRLAHSAIRLFFFKTVMPRSTKRIAKTFTQDCTTYDEAVNTPFEDLSAKLREDKVVTSAKEMLHRVIQLANWGRRGRPLISGTVNVKIYLAAYMIAARPNHVFENVTELEKKVLDASKPTLLLFHATAKALSRGESWHDVKKNVAQKLPSLLCTYLRTFKEWKLADEKKLAGRLTHALRGLEEAEKGLKNEEADVKIRAELQAQQKRLREKLAQIAGDKAVQEHDKERLEREGRKGGSATTRSVQAATVSRDADVALPPAAPAGHVGGMTNEQLAHELLLYKDFKLDEKYGMSDDKLVHTKIRETFERAFWESLVEDLSTAPPTYARVLSVLTEIKTGIEGLSQGHAEESKIGEVIDMEAITTQLRQNKLDYRACEALVDEIVKVLLSIHDRMRSTDRHTETVQRWKDVRQKMLAAAGGKDQLARARATCEALEMVLDRVHAIRVDTANNKLRAIAPVIREHGVEYEKSHFVKKLDKGTIGLDRTRQWIKHTVAELQTARDARVSVQDLAKGRPEDFEVVLYVAMVNLIADYPNWGGVLRGKSDEDLVPETMMLDLLRIKALNMHFHTDVVSSVILVTTELQCREEISDATVRADIFRQVQDIVVNNPPKPNSPRVTIKLVMAALAKAMDKPTLDACQTMLEKNVKRASPVHNAMTKIFKKVWYYLIKDRDAEPPCKVPDCARPLLTEVRKHSASLATVALHNKKVHVTRYNPIIKASGDELTRNMVAKGPAPAPAVAVAGGAASHSQH
mmetsp:Transcript_6055/g.14576  ORF Transcript_6055/g.14576 Transcript_6055/m.14576 type:complete len:1063 (-) Transcript_6055:927-4115(-)